MAIEKKQNFINCIYFNESFSMVIFNEQRVYVCKTPLRSSPGATATKVPGKPMLAAPWLWYRTSFPMAEREPMFDVWDIWLEI
jgi:hypothetical protein